MTDRLTQVVVVGARGRMGMQLVRSVMESDTMTLAGAVDRSGGPGLGQDAGTLVGLPEIGVKVTEEIRPQRGAVVVDFSLPSATEANIAQCIEHRAPLVLGTTGISAQTRDVLKEAGKEVAIVSAANFSVGITLMVEMAAQAARALGTDWDAELFEIHHRHKRDAPSGTALRIGKAIAQNTGRTFDDALVTGRASRSEPRTREEIGISAVRGGDSVGEHTVLFFGNGERLELSHRATDRAIFARGALRAARWVADREPGLYDMKDVLGF